MEHKEEDKDSNINKKKKEETPKLNMGSPRVAERLSQVSIKSVQLSDESSQDAVVELAKELSELELALKIIDEHEKEDKENKILKERPQPDEPGISNEEAQSNDLPKKATEAGESSVKPKDVKLKTSPKTVQDPSPRLELVDVLSELSVDGIVRYIKEGHAKKIITMVGAGISTGAGIPDFRSPGSGLYHNLQKYNLPYSQAIFELDYFMKHPEPFFTLAKELMPSTSTRPTLSHFFIKLLQDKGVLLRHYTQNIDSLERKAGVTDSYLVEAHGTFYYSHCLNCRKDYSYEHMKELILNGEIPKCTRCSGLVKPDIVFFGESLPQTFFQKLVRDFPSCDLLIIMGSSLAVEPFASLCTRVRPRCPRLLVNKEEVGDMVGLSYMKESNLRDVAWIGDCDEFSQMFAEKLGWAEDLDKLMKERKTTCFDV